MELFIVADHTLVSTGLSETGPDLLSAVPSHARARHCIACKGKVVAFSLHSQTWTLGLEMDGQGARAPGSQRCSAYMPWAQR